MAKAKTTDDKEVSVSSLVKEVNDLTETMEKAKEKLVKKLKPKFSKIFVPFLDKWPQAERLGWRQYTPYFNDGEECTFSVHDLGVAIPGFNVPAEGEDEDDYENDEWLYEPLSDWTIECAEKPDTSDWAKEYRDDLTRIFGDWKTVKAFMKDFKALGKTFSSIPEDVMREMFDDHAKITVDRKGMDVEEYEHE